MIISAIVVGLVIIFLIVLSAYIKGLDSNDTNWDWGIFFLVTIILLCVIEIDIISTIIEKSKPTPMDVYQGKTTLEYTIRDGVKIDSVVVFKEK